jgi:ABC-2 type transport system permease protein
VGGICGALLTTLSAWLSGVWFDLTLVGGIFERIANALPFVHIVRLERALLACDFREAASNILVPTVYILLFTVLSILLFMRQMKRQ